MLEVCRHFNMVSTGFVECEPFVRGVMKMIAHGKRSTEMTNNKSVNKWIEEIKNLVNPDNVIWVDGSEKQIEELRAESVKTGEMIKLNEELLPGCYLHRTKQNDVARVEDRTFICTTKKEDAGPTNNWCDPKEMYERLYNIARNSYQGKTMYIIPFSMGPIGSPLAKIGIEITDSIYVVLNMIIMTRVDTKVMDVLGDSNDWVRCFHSRCDIDKEKRYICQFPEDNTIISVNSGYGGNVLLGKKCFALRIASYQGWKEGWMAEHMLQMELLEMKAYDEQIALRNRFFAAAKRWTDDIQASSEDSEDIHFADYFEL